MLTEAMRLGSGTGSGRSSKASAKLNMAEVAPMPMASEQTLTMMNPGDWRHKRIAWRKDFNILDPPRIPGMDASAVGKVQQKVVVAP
jgi:hypothetical protein